LIHLSWLGTSANTVHDDHDDVVDRGEIDIVHDQDLVITEARLGVDVGLSRGFGASLVLPLRLSSTSIAYFDTDGMEVELTEPGIHHRNETVSGLGDPILLGSYGRAVSGWRLGGRAGFSIPIGRTEVDPFALGDQGLRHQHMQLGTGTINPIVSVEASRSWGLWRLGGFLFTQQVVYENSKGYQAGDRYAGGLALRRRLRDRWTLRGGVELQGETAERWNGTVHLDDGNRGRLDVMLAAGASWSASSRLTVDLGVKVPVVTHVVGGQLDMPAIAELGVTWSFGGRSEAADEHDHDDEHEHDHHHEEEEGHDHEGDEHQDDRHEDDHEDAHLDTTGLDVADLPEPERVDDILPVPGKITILDFWATWCEPCKVLEPALVDLVRANPDRVALRRIDVSDSEVWDIELPYVRVFDASGRKVIDQRSDGNLDALIMAVRAVVDPPPTTVVEPDKAKPKKKRKKAAARRHAITVTELGFEPGNITVPVGEPVVLVFERKTEQTCATEVVMTVDGVRIEKELPLGKVVELKITFPTKGTITYACAMDMIRGTITVK